MYRSCQGLVDVAIAAISEAACMSRCKIVTEVTSDQTDTKEKKKERRRGQEKDEDDNITKAGDKRETKTRVMAMAKTSKTNGDLNTKTGIRYRLREANVAKGTISLR